jgi:hypothetical protein
MGPPRPAEGVRAQVAGALLLAGLVLLQPGGALPLSTAPLQAHTPIVIQGDGEWCDRLNAQGVDDDGVRNCLEADGSVNAPYRIRGWKFNLAAYPPGTAAITIANTTKHWVVEGNGFHDTRQERVRDGLHLVGASDDRGRVEHNRFEHLSVAITAREWFDHAPCTLAQAQAATCMWRRISAPDVEGNAFRTNEVALLNGPNLGLTTTQATGKVGLNNFDQSFQWAYVEILPTKWRPPLQHNWWGAPTGPGEDVSGLTAGGGRMRAQCASSQVSPTGTQPLCVTPWLPAPDPAAGPLHLWG